MLDIHKLALAEVSMNSYLSTTITGNVVPEALVGAGDGGLVVVVLVSENASCKSSNGKYVLQHVDCSLFFWFVLDTT